MMETLGNVSAWEVVEKVCAVFVAASIFVQISPIKINPVSWLAKRIGRGLNGDVMNELTTLKTDVERLEKIQGERNARNARVRILQFGDELRHGMVPSKEHFDDVLMSVTEYTQYCRENPDFRNHVTEATTQYITKTYSKMLEENGFL